MAKQKFSKQTKDLWKKLNSVAQTRFGEFGFSTLSEEEMKEAIEIMFSKTKK